MEAEEEVEDEVVTFDCSSVVVFESLTEETSL